MAEENLSNQETNNMVPETEQAPECCLSDTGRFRCKKCLIIAGIVIILLIIAGVVIYLLAKNNETGGSEKNNLGSSVKDQAAVVREGAMILAPVKTNLAVAETVEVKILLDTKNSDINLAAAAVEYNPTEMSLEEVSSEKSVLSLTVMESKGNGYVEIMRGEPGDGNDEDKDDGYNGSDGLLSVLKFKIKKIGSLVIKLNPEKAKMILDDGLGTEMKVEVKNATIEVK